MTMFRCHKPSFFLIGTVFFFVFFSLFSLNLSFAKESNLKIAHEQEDQVRKLYECGEYRKALGVAKEVLVLKEKTLGIEACELAISLNNLGMIYKALCQYSKAKVLYERALRIDEKYYGPDHFELSADLNNLGAVYYTLGSFDKAIQMFEKALRIDTEFYGHHHPKVAVDLNNIGTACIAKRDILRAKDVFERALQIIEQYYGHGNPKTSKIYSNLGGCYYRLEEYSSAKKKYERALTIAQKGYGPRHPVVAVCMNNLARLHKEMDQLSEAEALYRKAISIGILTQNPEILWHSEYGMSKLLQRQGKFFSAIFFGKRAVNTIQCLRSRISMMEKNLRNLYMTNKKDVYQNLADLLIDQGRLPEAQQVLVMLKEEEYFDFIRREAKRRDVKTTTADFTDIERPWIERYDKIIGNVAAIGNELAGLEKKITSGLTDEELTRYKKLKEDLKIVRKAFKNYFSELMKVLDKAGKERYSAIKGKRIDKPKKLQNALKELGHGAVAIHYLVTEDKLRIILTTPETQLAKDAPVSAKELSRQIMAFRQTLKTDRLDPRPQAQKLYNMVLRPIAENLKGAESETLMVSLDGVLRYLPLAALYDGQHYVAEEYNLAIFTSAAGLDIKDLPSKMWQVAGLGLSEVKGYDPLPAVPKELEGIVRRDDRDEDGVAPGVIYLNTAFTRKALEGVLGGRYPVLHIASHFQFNPGNVSDSHLILGDGNLLTLAQITEEDYDFGGVDLITLSACNTGMVSGGTGSEVESFGALAQDQGAKGVLATLWPVADQSTGVFMQNFYRLRGKGITKAEALRQAQVMFIRGNGKSTTDAGNAKRGTPIYAKKDESENSAPFNPAPNSPFAHPHFWAPFILMGNWL